MPNFLLLISLALLMQFGRTEILPFETTITSNLHGNVKTMTLVEKGAECIGVHEHEIDHKFTSGTVSWPSFPTVLSNTANTGSTSLSSIAKMTAAKSALTTTNKTITKTTTKTDENKKIQKQTATMNKSY